MALLISNAILHTLNNHGTGTMMSDVELDVDSETCFEFIGKHVRRLVKASVAREATFRPESAVYAMIKAYQKGEMSFKELSLLLADKLNSIMQDNKEIPHGDLLITSFDYSKQRYIAIVKLPYFECYTHRTVEREGGTEIQLVKNMSVLPGTSGKVTEACLIPYDPMVLRIVEQQFPVYGEMTSYFSELFLECETEPFSKKETAELIEEIASEVNTIYFNNDIEMESRMKFALVAAASEEEEEGLNLETAMKVACGDNQPAVEHFVSRAKESGLPHEVKLAKNDVHKEFKMQRIKADNGIEIKFPLELSQDPNAIQIVTNSDGTLSITLKNLRTAE